MMKVITLNEIPSWAISVGASDAPSVVTTHERKKHVGAVYTRANPQRIMAFPNRDGNFLVCIRNRWTLICPIRSGSS